jgi:hypothetical protein
MLEKPLVAFMVTARRLATRTATARAVGSILVNVKAATSQPSSRRPDCSFETPTIGFNNRSAPLWTSFLLRFVLVYSILKGETRKK